MSRLPMCLSDCSLRCELYPRRLAESFGNSKEISWKFFGEFFRALSEVCMVRQPAYLYEFGPFRLDAADRLLSCGGDAVPLSPKGFDLLLALVERHGRLLEKEELMKLVWPDTFVEEANLSYTISLVRKALGAFADPQLFIETVSKHGYRFIAEVRRGRAGGATLSVPETPSGLELEPVGGAMPLDSQFYITRPADEHFRAAI